MAEALADFHLLRPGFLWLFALAPLLVLGYIRYRRAVNQWTSVIQSDLLTALMPETVVQSKRLPWVATICFVLIVVAVTGPTWERRPQTVAQSSNALVIVLDLSLSMLAEDLAPSRVERAKHKITDVLENRTEGFASIVAYAGSAHVVAPLTDDYRTLLNLLSSLNPTMMPSYGSNAAQAIELAKELLSNHRNGVGQILLVTDGVDSIATVTRSLSTKYATSVLGIGTTEGGTIPGDALGKAGKVLVDSQGTVVAKLDEERLQALATLGGGRYSRISIDDADITHLAAEIEGDLLESKLELEYDNWVDMGFLFVVPLIVLMSLALRRGVLIGLMVFIALPNEAGWLTDLFVSRDMQAHRELTEGRPDLAEQLFEHEDWKAIAQYRQEKFEDAKTHFENAADVAGRYNFATTLAKNGEIVAAIETYAALLEREPSHEDARFNKELLEKFLEQQQQSTGEGDQSQDNDADEHGDQGQSNPSDAEQADQTSSAESDQDGDQSDEQQQTANELADEQGSAVDEEQPSAEEMEARETQDTYERWLRRIPDDPGHLLQRKFRDELNKRDRSDTDRRKNRKVW